MEQTNEPNTRSVNDPSSGGDVTSEKFTSASARVGGRAAPLILLVAGLLGGGLAWVLVEKTEGYCVPSQAVIDKLPPIGQPIPDDVMKMLHAEKFRTECRNTALSIGLFGACVGAFLGLGRGISRRSITGAGLGLVTGALCGGLLAAAAGYAEVLVDERLSRDEAVDNTIKAMIDHAFAWMLAGGGIALGVSLPSCRGRMLIRCLGAGMAAGIIAGLLYAPLAAMLFPGEKSELVVPTGHWNRLFWISLAAGLLGLAIGRESRGGKAAA